MKVSPEGRLAAVPGCRINPPLAVAVLPRLREGRREWAVDPAAPERVHDHVGRLVRRGAVRRILDKDVVPVRQVRFGPRALPFEELHERVGRLGFHMVFRLQSGQVFGRFQFGIGLFQE